MANNYCSSSSKLVLKKGQISKAKLIIDRIEKELEKEDGYVGVIAEVESDGIWFHEDESITLEHVVAIASAILEELKIDEPFTFSWAYTCSKPRLDEFGGGACSIKRGEKPFYVDAQSIASQRFSKTKG